VLRREGVGGRAGGGRGGCPAFGRCGRQGQRGRRNNWLTLSQFLLRPAFGLLRAIVLPPQRQRESPPSSRSASPPAPALAAAARPVGRPDPPALASPPGGTLRAASQAVRGVEDRPRAHVPAAPKPAPSSSRPGTRVRGTSDGPGGRNRPHGLNRGCSQVLVAGGRRHSPIPRSPEPRPRTGSTLAPAPMAGPRAMYRSKWPKPAPRPKPAPAESPEFTSPLESAMP